MVQIAAKIMTGVIIGQILVFSILVGVSIALKVVGDGSIGIPIVCGMFLGAIFMLCFGIVAMGL